MLIQNSSVIAIVNTFLYREKLNTAYPVTSSTCLYTDLMLDSLDVVELMLTIEDELDAWIDEDRLAKFNNPTVGELVALIEEI